MEQERYYLIEDLQLGPGPWQAHFLQGQEEGGSDKENNKGGNL